MFGLSDVGVDGALIVTIASCIASFVGVVAAGLSVVGRNGMQSRMKTLRRKREELSRQQKEKLKQKTLRDRLQKKSVSALLLERLRISHLTELRAVRDMMIHAGWRDKSAPAFYVISHMVAPVIAFLLASAYVSAKPALHASPKGLAILAGATLFGFALPWILARNAVVKRQTVLVEQFPDCLDLLLVCVEAGLSVEVAFNKVAEDLAESEPQIAIEVGFTAAELAMLGDRGQAFENMYRRTGLSEFKSLSTALLQADRYGTPVSAALRVLSEESRTTRALNAEKKAAALPAKLTVPLIIFFLPVLLMAIIGPAAIQLIK